MIPDTIDIQALRAKYGIPAQGVDTNNVNAARVKELQDAWAAADKAKEAASPAGQARGGADTNFSDLPGNILPSIGRSVGSVATAVTHPIKTVEALGSTVVGGMSELGRKLGTGANVDKPPTPEEQTFDHVVQFFKDRYGDPESLKKTIINDPAGVAMDIATILSGGAGLAGKTGTIGKAVSKASEIVDPVTQTAKLGSKVVEGTVKGAGEVGAQGLGFTTGAGAEAVKEAFRNPSPEFTAALRGKTKAKDIVDVAKRALNDVEDARGSEYRAKLAEISKQGDSLDISPVHTEIDKQLDKFGVSIGADGQLDFSRSAITKPEARTGVQELYDTIKDWGSRKGDRTPAMLDILKRRLGDYNLDSGQARALVSAVQNKVKNILTDQVPGYKEMTSGYAQASDFIDELDRTLALGSGKSTETAITKLTSTLKKDKEYRVALVKQLEQASGESITPKIAGAALNSWLPRGLAEKLFAGGAGGAALVNPQLILGIATAAATLSPRLVGEFARALGIASNKVGDVVQAVSAIKQKIPAIGTMSASEIEKLLFQAGRTESIDTTETQ